MRYAILAIGLSAALLWDAVANYSQYRNLVMGYLNAVLQSIGI